ncbi:hypothetical protein [Brachyspira murdochii]|uniref:hypothetical protein n=1 Tax=Brachyspira murdochii TaxID=84378 RepID=UPI0012F5091D|nr:hypothetical protein [Brachyspira murdochii]
MNFIRIEGKKSEIIIDEETISYLAYNKENKILSIYNKTNNFIVELEIDEEGYNKLLNNL